MPTIPHDDLLPRPPSRLDRELDVGEVVRWVSQPIARVLTQDLNEQFRMLQAQFGDA